LKTTSATLMFLLAASASGQWLECAFAVPDSLCSGLLSPWRLVCNPLTNTVYVGGSGLECLTAIDGVSGAKLAKIDLDGSIRALCCNQGDNFVYCAMSRAEVVVIDGASNTIVTGISLPGESRALCYNPIQNKLYAASWYPDKITVIDCATNQVLRTFAFPGGEHCDMCYYRPLDKIYCACSDGAIVVVDCSIDTVVAAMSPGSWPYAICCDSLNNKIYCVNEGASTISVIDPDADTILRTLSVPRNPYSLCHNPREGKLYCGSSNTQSLLSIFDTAHDSLLARLNLPSGPQALCYVASENEVYCLCTEGLAPYNSVVVVIDGETNSIVGRAVAGRRARDLCDNRRGDRLFTANSYDNSVSLIDGGGDSLLANITLNGGPVSLCWSSISGKVYCANNYSDNVTVIDGGTNAVLKSIAIGDQPLSLCYNPTDDRVFCSLGGLCQVKTIDCGTDSVIRTVGVVSPPREMCYDLDDNRVYCACSGGFVFALDGLTGSLLAAIPAGPGTDAVCYNPVGNKVYAANSGNNTVSVISCSTNTVRTNIPVDGPPVALCFNPQENRVYCLTDVSINVIDGAGDYVLTNLNHPWVPSVAMDLCYNDISNKVYCDCHYTIGGHEPTRVAWVSVYDGHDNTALAEIRLPGYWPLPCSLRHNPQNNKVYCTDYQNGKVQVIDGTTDSLTNTLDVPAGPTALEWNSDYNRTYVTCLGMSQIAVIRDSLVSGFTEVLESSNSDGRLMPTICRGVLGMHGERGPVTGHTTELLDAAGRCVMKLHRGANDVSAVAPGVYFVCDRGFRSQGSKVPSRKVIIQH